MKDTSMKNIYYLFAINIAIFSSSLNAQWVNTNLPYTGNVLCLAAGPNGSGDTNLFAGTEGGGVFLSSNDGASWQDVNNGLDDSATVYSLAIGGSNVFAGTNGLIYHSTNSGASWEVTDSSIFDLAECIAISDSNFFAGTKGWNGGPG